MSLTEVWDNARAPRFLDFDNLASDGDSDADSYFDKNHEMDQKPQCAERRTSEDVSSLDMPVQQMAKCGLRKSLSMSDIPRQLEKKIKSECPLSEESNGSTLSITSNYEKSRVKHNTSAKSSLMERLRSLSQPKMDQSIQKFVSAAEMIRKMEIGTPKRFRSVPQHKKNAFKEEHADISKMPKLPTAIQPFNLSSGIRKLPEIEKKPEPFRAKPIPKLVLANMEQAKSKPPSRPPTPTLPSENSARSARSSSCSSEGGKKRPTPQKKPNTRPEPFSFEWRTGEMQRKREVALKKMEEENKVLIKPARKMPTAPPFVPDRPRRILKDVSAFELNLERRVHERQKYNNEAEERRLYAETMAKKRSEEQLERELEQLEKMRKVHEHKAKPVRRYKPLPHVLPMPLTEPQTPNFASKEFRRHFETTRNAAE